MSDPARAAMFAEPIPPPDMGTHARDTQSTTSTSSIPLSGYNHPSSPRPNMPLELYNQNQTPRILGSTDPMMHEPYPMPTSRTTTLQTMTEERLQAFLEWESSRREQNLNSPPRNMVAANTQQATTRNGRTDSTYGSADDTGAALLPSAYQAQNMQLQPQIPSDNQLQPHNQGGPGGQVQACGPNGQQQMSQFVSVRPGHRFGTVTASENARVLRGNVVRSLNEENPYARQHEYGNALITGRARMHDGDVTQREMEGFWNN